MMKKNGYVYRWDNLINGQSYIGSHNGSRKGYIGSGTAFKKEWVLYDDEECWVRTILYRGSEFRQKEAEWIIKENAIHSPVFLNDMLIAEGIMIRSDQLTKRIAKTLSITRVGAGNPMFGREVTVDHRRKLGAVHRKAQAIECPHCGRSIKNSAGSYTRFHGDNCRQNPVGPRFKPVEVKKRVMSEETKVKLSKSRRGMKLSAKRTESHSAKIGKANSVQVTCPHCGKIGSKGPMHQHHFTNCKARFTLVD